MKKFFVLFFPVLMLSAACVQQSPAQLAVKNNSGSSYNKKLIVRDKNLQVEVVSTPEKMQQGLSGREKMGEDEGMLFVFTKPGAYTFWMKDMKFNLDFVWILKGKVIGITANASAPALGTLDKVLEVYSPPAAIDSVLEVSAGWAEKNRIAIGDAVQLK